MKEIHAWLKENFHLGVVHFNIVIYAFAFWVTQPSMPFLLKEFSSSSLSFGYFASLFNIVQLIGGLTIGNLQDHFSGRMAMNITQLGSLSVYLCAFFSNSLTMLYISRLPTIFQQSMQVAQAYVSKVCKRPEDRPVMLSRLSLSYSIGMICGSSINGYVAEITPFGAHGPFLLAAAVTAIVALLNMFFLRDVSTAIVKKEEKEKEKGKAKKTDGAKPSNPLTEYIGIISSVFPVVVFLSLLFITKSLYETVYNLTLIEDFGVKQGELGTLISLFAILGFISNVFMLPAAMKIMKEATLTRLAVFLSAIAYIAAAFTKTISPFFEVPLKLGFTCFHLVIRTQVSDNNDDENPYEFTSAIRDRLFYITLLSVLSLTASALYTLSTAYISRSTSKAVHGQAVALGHALRSAVGIVCPIIASMCYDKYGGASIALIDGALLFASVALYRERKPKEE